MVQAREANDRIKVLIVAFKDDHFDVDPLQDVFEAPEGGIGITARHETATVGSTGEKKKVFYVEGSPRDMGYLVGRMAERDVARMCLEYIPNFPLTFSRGGPRTRWSGPLHWFLHTVLGRWFNRLVGQALEVIMGWAAGNIYPDVPRKYIDELEGVLAGCRAAARLEERRTAVTWADLWILNVGFDALLAAIAYTGGKCPAGEVTREVTLPVPVVGRFLKIKPGHLRIPVACNGFAVFEGDPGAQEAYHYFGRNFQFTTCDVFQDVACMIIQNPDDGELFVSMTAPGMIGCATGMNASGVGVGVDMSPAANCDPLRPGLNSLLLCRKSIEEGATCDEAVDVMRDAQRGTAWIYVLADGANQKACVVEAGYKPSDLNPFDPIAYLPESVYETLRKEGFPDEYPYNPDESGLMVRWSDYAYPAAYGKLNPALFRLFHKRYDPDAFAERGYIAKRKGCIGGSWRHRDALWRTRNCPSFSFFPPQREDRANLVLTTNGFLIPEMRLCSMFEWTSDVSGSEADDTQWRYDELNNELLSALDEGPISYDKAKEIINFLRPDGPFYKYYKPCCKPAGQVQVEGSVSLLDLRNKTIDSLYGYYGDEWIKISLARYEV